jgi:hypothetical protein
MPTPLAKAEAEDLALLLQRTEETREELMAAEAAAKIAESRFQRRYRELRMAHGAKDPWAWDPVANEWRDPRQQQRPGQGSAPVVDLGQLRVSPEKKKRKR